MAANEITLTALLEAKEAAHAAFSQAGVVARKGADDKLPMSERLKLDLAYRVALRTYCDADNAYNAALDAFVAQQAAA